MFIFLLLNILVLVFAYFIVYRSLKIKGVVDSVIALFVIYFSEIVFIELVLGLTGVLCLKNVIVLGFVLLISAYLLTKKNDFSFPSFKLGQYFNELLSNKIFIFIFSVGVTFFLMKILVNLLNPPAGWDSLNYHFTFAVEWLKQGNLNVPITIFDDPSPTYYPINGSLFYLWLMLPLKSVFIADLGQAPFFVIAVIAVYGISRKIDLNRTRSFYSAALFALIPNFFKQLQIAYVDIMVGSLFLVCVNFLLSLKKDFNLQNVLIYSLSLGLLIGTKTIALPYSILLLIPFLVMLLRNNKMFYLGIIVIFCILIFGGFSYFRNLIETGNPLYPLDFKLFNMHIFSGVIDKAIYSSHFSSFDYSLGKMLFHEGLGGQALFFILPGALLALPVAFIKRKGLDFNLGYFLLLPILIFLVYRYILPLGNLRYLYAMMGLGIILGFYIFDTLKVNKLVVNILVVLCILASISELAKRQELITSIIITATLFFILSSFKKARLFYNKIFLTVSIALIVVAIFCAEKFYNINEFHRYQKMVKYSGFWPDATKAWDWLNSNTTGNNIAYTGRAVPFPLYGSSLKNNVYYVSVNKIQPAKLHYFNNSKYEYGPGFESLLKSIEQEYNYRGKADYKTWLDNLLGANTDYIFVYSLQQTKNIIFPVEDSWAKSKPDRFKPIFNNNTIHIYKVIK